MGYIKEEILSRCCKAIEDVSTLYKQGFINYRGITTDTKEFYTEIISEFLCDNIQNYKSIPNITRVTSYKVDGHDGQYLENSTRIEEIAAMKIFLQSNKIILGKCF